MPLSPPKLTETEMLKIENVTLKKALLESQMKIVRDEHASLVRQLEEEHPGWQWDDAQGFTQKAEGADGPLPK